MQIRIIVENFDILHISNLKEIVVQRTLASLDIDGYFTNLEYHSCDEFKDVKISLIEQIIINFVKIQKFHHIKLQNQDLSWNIRQKLNKLILFYHQ